MQGLFVLVLAVVGCIVLYAISVAPKRRAPRDERSLRRELDRFTHDPRASQSLVERERERSPEASERERLEAILRRLQRERRR